MIRALARLQPWTIFLLRITLSVAMLYNGRSKVIPAGGLFHGHLTSAMDRYAAYVVSLGLPHFLGYVSALTEFLGGICLILRLPTLHLTHATGWSSDQK